MEDIALIDLADASRGNAASESLSRYIDRACRETGFFTVRGHGIEATVLDEAHFALKQFFSLPSSEKFKCKLEADFANRGADYTPYGYSALLEENAYAYMGQLGRPSDYVEKFTAGRRILNDEEALPFIDDDPGRELRRKLKTCYIAYQELAARILELLTLPLGLSGDFFATRTDKAYDSMRGHLYPVYSAELNNDQGMAPHTDGSLITLLTQTTSGIQLKTRSGEWITPQFHGRDQIIVNIGDLMADWTKNKYVSTPHRVVLNECERQSIVFFKVTNDDATG